MTHDCVYLNTVCAVMVMCVCCTCESVRVCTACEKMCVPLYACVWSGLLKFCTVVQTDSQRSDTWSCLRAWGHSGTPLRGLPDSLTHTHTLDEGFLNVFFPVFFLTQDEMHVHSSTIKAQVYAFDVTGSSVWCYSRIMQHKWMLHKIKGQ